MEQGADLEHESRFDEALEMHEKALSMRQAVLPATHPDIATSFGNIAIVYDSKGEYDKALEMHEKALAMRQTTLPATHPNISNSMYGIATLQMTVGNHTKALKTYEDLLQVLKLGNLPATDPIFSDVINNIIVLKAVVSRAQK